MHYRSVIGSLTFVIFVGCGGNKTDIDVKFLVSQNSTTPAEGVEVMRHFLASKTDVTDKTPSTTPNTELQENSAADGTVTLTLVRGTYLYVGTRKTDYMTNWYFFSVADEDPVSGQDRYTQDLSSIPILVAPSTSDSPYCQTYKGVSSSSTTGWIRVYKSSGSFNESDDLKIIKVNGSQDVASGADLADSTTAPGGYPYFDVYEAETPGNAAAMYNAAVAIDTDLDKSDKNYNQYDVVLNGVTQRVQVRKCRASYVTTVVF